MYTDLETGMVPPQNTEILAFDENLNISSDSLGPSSNKLRVSTHVSRVQIKQKSTGSKRRDRRPRGPQREASEIEANAWKGRVQERIKLVQKGYQSLAIICTFLAGVQSSILSMTATQTDVTAQIVNGFFFAGLVADIGAAILSAASQRWFEMIRRDEAEHVYDYLKEAQSDTRSEDAVEEQTNSSSSQIKNVAGKEKGEEEHVDVTVVPSATSTVSKRYYGIELWLFFALKAPPYAAVLGFAFMVAGVMLWVWAHEAVVAKVLCTVLCVLLVILLPPFAIHHDRKEALKRFKLKRVSG